MDIIRIDYCSLILPDVGAQFCVISILRPQKLDKCEACAISPYIGYNNYTVLG